MTIMDAEVRETVSAYLAQKLTVPARVVVFTETDDTIAPGAGSSSEQARELLEEIASVSDAVRLEAYDVKERADLVSEWGILAAPTIAIGRADEANGAAPRVRYTGYPGGHEFTSFLETLGSLGREHWGLSADTVELLGKVDRDIDIKTFVTPT